MYMYGVQEVTDVRFIENFRLTQTKLGNRLDLPTKLVTGSK